jgi:hypothetical protein
LLVLAVLLSLIAVGVYVHILVKLSMRAGLARGLLGLVFPPYTFYWGWRNARREEIKTAMIAWTAILAFLALLVIYTIASG